MSAIIQPAEDGSAPAALRRPRVIDAHVHQWDHRKTPREASLFVKLFGWHRPLLHWLAGKVFPKDLGEFFGGPAEVLADYLPSHYGADSVDGQVDGFVHVEAGWKGKGPLGPVDETRWLESLGTPLLAAIVGYADLRLGDAVAEVLEAHLAASSRFRGVRYILAHHPDKRILSLCEAADLMNDTRWRAGYAQLAAYGLSFDATVYHHQLDSLVALARDVPDVPLIVCHAGTPTAYGGPFGGEGQTAAERAVIARRWRESMGRLAALPNVYVKISGLAMPILGWGYHQRAAVDTTRVDATRVAADLQPMVDFLIDRFGAERCMFGSNFPVDRVSLTWRSLYDAFAATVAGRSDAERQALFHGTASRVYRLETALRS